LTTSREGIHGGKAPLIKMQKTDKCFALCFLLFDRGLCYNLYRLHWHAQVEILLRHVQETDTIIIIIYLSEEQQDK